MHPALSVIVFTVASGAGYGLLVWLAVFSAAGWLPADPALGVAGLGAAPGLITVGLLSSTLHLGHPERAWRALSQWRSSWLSREGLAAMATYVPALLFAMGWVLLGDVERFFRVMAVAAAFLALVTVACTGMIYASLVTIRQWHNTWVVPGYLALALLTGALWLAVLAAAFGLFRPEMAEFAVLQVAIAGYVKLRYWREIDGGSSATTAETATGLGHLGKVRLLDGPATSETYVMREMGYRIARKHASRLRRIAGIALLAVPATVLVAAVLMAGSQPVALVLTLVAAVSGSFGVLVERWLFFAEAKHVSALYYGADGA